MAEHSILVVEDEHTLRRLLEYRLSKNYTVFTAANGEEALVRISEQLPDLIISDIMMPKMDGFALQAALHDRKETSVIPFIFLTAKADEQSRLKGRRTGVDDYITKPFDIDQLLARVERLLARTSHFQSQLDTRIGEDFSRKLIPKKLPRVDGYSLEFYNTPREVSGGDIFDWTEVKPGVYFITIGDVMGKGLQAKVYTFGFIGYIRSMLHALLRTSDSPAEIMTRINQLLVDDPPIEDSFATLLFLRWEPARNLVTYANGGHPRPVVITERGAEILSYSDIILGLDGEAEFKDTSVSIAPGAAIFAYTDGLLEQQMASGEQLGEEGVVRAAERAYGREHPLNNMVNHVLDESAKREFADDILLFWMRRETSLASVRQTPRWFSPFGETTDAP